MLYTLYYSTVVTCSDNVTMSALFFSQYAMNGPRGVVFPSTTSGMVRNSELI